MVVLLLTAHCSLPTAFAQDTPLTNKFPTALNSADSLGRTADAPSATLNATINSSVTTFVVTGSASSFPSSGLSLKIDNETILCTTRSSATFSGCTRGAKGTTATTHLAGSAVRSPILSAQRDVLVADLLTIETKLGSGSDTPVANDVFMGTGAGTSGWVAQPAIDCINCSLDAADLLTGTIPNARFPSTLPALNGSLLTNLDPVNFSTVVPITKGGSGASTAAGARANFGLGTMATQNANGVSITGGSLSGVTFGSGLTFSAGFSVPGTLTATAFVGNGAGITGLTGATGGISNTGSTTIGADTDVNSVGIIDLQTRNISRLVVANNGMIGLNTAAPAASLEIHKRQSGDLGSEVALLIGPIDTGSGAAAGFGITTASQANIDVGARPDQFYSFGYNPEAKPGENRWLYNWESYYGDSVSGHQMEHYMVAPDGTRIWQMRYVIDGPSAGSLDYNWDIDAMDFYDKTFTSYYLNINKTTGINVPASAPNTVGLAFSNAPEFAIQGAGGDISGGGFKGVVTNVVDLSAAGLAYHKSELNLFGAGDLSSVDHYFTWGGGRSGSETSDNDTWTGFRSNHSTGRLQYAENFGTTNTPPTFRDFNDELGIYQHHHNLVRSLGSASGDWIEIGAVAREGGSGIFEIFTWDQGDGTSGKQYVVPSSYDYYNNGSAWQQLSPLLSTDRNADGYAIDIQGNTGLLRLRRLGGGGTGPASIKLVLKRYGDTTAFNSFTASSASGSSASVSGLYGATPLSTKNSTVYIYDGSVMQPVTIGAASSCGAARCLTVPN